MAAEDDEHRGAWMEGATNQGSWGRVQRRFGGTGAMQPLGDQTAAGDIGDYLTGRRDPRVPEDGPFFGVGPRGWARSDARIRDDICEEMAHEGYLDASEVEVEVEHGEVTLRGTVPTREQKRIAEQIADMAPGVRDVHNRLTLHGRRHRPAEPRQPDQGVRGSFDG